MACDPFEVHRGKITQSAVEPFWVIEGFDIIEDGRAGVLARGEGFLVQPFGFESTPEGFHGRVVVTVALGAHAGLKVTSL